MITTPLRILLVEDTESDVLLTKRHLNRIVNHPIIEVVEDLTACRDRMINFVPDVVISDYNLPTCNGLEVLQLVRTIDEAVPFIFLTGTIEDEELAANTILAGASGYILKKHMNNLDEKLMPLLKTVVLNMVTKEEVRERLRQNKIAVNQVYAYLDSLKTENNEQRENIDKVKDTITRFNMEDDDQ